jgi:hypothetical protein
LIENDTCSDQVMHAALHEPAALFRSAAHVALLLRGSERRKNGQERCAKQELRFHGAPRKAGGAASTVNDTPVRTEPGSTNRESKAQWIRRKSAAVSF